MHDLAEARRLTQCFLQKEGRRPRVLIARHENQHALAAELADMGFDVDLSPSSSPSEIAQHAIDNDVHVIAMAENCPAVETALWSMGRNNIFVFPIQDFVSKLQLLFTSHENPV